LKNPLPYYYADVEAVNSKVVALVPEKFFSIDFRITKIMGISSGL
jgi:hypothetical protein